VASEGLGGGGAPGSGRVAAHRGGGRAAPENTIAAFRQAMSDGARALELEVQLSADGRVVVIHDPEVDRTTDGRGAVRFLASSEIRALDAGSWYGPGFAGERVPFLDEVLALTAGRARLHIELKGAGGRHLAERVADEVRRHDAAARVVLMSFSLDAALAARRVAGLIPVLPIVGEPIEDPLGFVRATNLSGLNQGSQRWDATTIARFHEDGRLVHGSLINDPAVLAPFFAAGGDLADSDDAACFGYREGTSP
jgi:glycerophosphoryl diester phosphodiesterase